MSIAAYQKSAQTLETPVEREIRAFTRVIGKLEAADPSNPLSVIPAIHENDRLWIVLQAELASPDNALPGQLRANLLSLALWSQRHGAAVIEGQADMQPLIDVNKDIVAGLMVQRRNSMISVSSSSASVSAANAA